MGGNILLGGSGIESEGNFVQPTIVEISPDAPVVKEEFFGPVLYVMKFQLLMILQTLKEAIEIDNSVPQGLSSSIFTRKPDAIFKRIGLWVMQAGGQFMRVHTCTPVSAAIASARTSARELGMRSIDEDVCEESGICVTASWRQSD